ncbi:MAG: YdiU family protein [Betaproteobacteria bacterium]|nr:YdiU family protein [Betaproteobacteria bacterium]
MEGLDFRNTFVDALPADALLVNRPRLVANAAYTRVEPTPVASARLLAWSDRLGEFLGIDRPPASGPAAEVLAGNRLLPSMKPYAARYGGHQFGVWAGQLGDGRAITLGEIVATDGSRQELQLKGAGKTPYSRTADGRAVLRSSLREFACSEAMFHLGVPTTRALSLVATGEPVIRDMFYDGNPAPEPGAVVCRVAPSFLRFGNFQIFAAQRETEGLKRLVEYVMREFYLALPSVEAFFEEVCRRTALLLVDWMRFGFVHGVMNTDNMSVLGQTIDYGPYGWLEGYDPGWTPNTTDAQSLRYTYGNQPGIAQWNLARFGEALLPLVPDPAPLEASLKLYAELFNEGWQKALAAKLGLRSLDEPGDEELMNDLFVALQQEETDFTLFFRKLADVSLERPDLKPLEAAFYGEQEPSRREVLLAWIRRYAERAKRENDPLRRERMNAANPKYVFRNYLAQTAIDALAQDDASVLERLMRVLERPFDEQPEHEDLAARRPEWARHKAGCSALSCSS